MTEPQTDRHLAQRERAARYRDRRRSGRVLVPVEVTFTARQALIDLGLIEREDWRNPAALAMAIEQFLMAAPAAAAMGAALYPGGEE